MLFLNILKMIENLLIIVEVKYCFIVLELFGVLDILILLVCLIYLLF